MTLYPQCFLVGLFLHLFKELFFVKVCTLYFSFAFSRQGFTRDLSYQRRLKSLSAPRYFSSEHRHSRRDVSSMLNNMCKTSDYGVKSNISKTNILGLLENSKLNQKHLIIKLLATDILVGSILFADDNLLVCSQRTSFLNAVVFFIRPCPHRCFTYHQYFHVKYISIFLIFALSMHCFIYLFIYLFIEYMYTG